MPRTCTCRAASAEAVVQMQKPHFERCTHAASHVKVSSSVRFFAQLRCSAFSFSCSPSSLTAHFRRLRAFPMRPPHRVLGPPPARIRLLHGARRTSTRTRTSLSRHFFAQWRFSASSPCALFTRNRCFHGFSFPPSSPPWRAERRAVVQSAFARRQLTYCRNRRNGSAQKSPVCWRDQQTSPV
jgi:hypothetical protein